jgi:hypothetical protein
MPHGCTDFHTLIVHLHGICAVLLLSYVHDILSAVDVTTASLYCSRPVVFKTELGTVQQAKAGIACTLQAKHLQRLALSISSI